MIQLRLCFEEDPPCVFGNLDDPAYFHHCAACEAEVERLAAAA